MALAEHLDVPVRRVRWLAVGAALCGGAGILFYLWLWAFVPLESEAAGRPGGVTRVVPVGWLLFGFAALCAIWVLALGPTAIAVSSVQAALVAAVAAMIVFALAAVAWEQFVETDAASRRFPAVRISAGALLLGIGVLEPIVWVGVGAPLAWVLFVLTFFAGAVVLLGPWTVRLWQELLAERTKRVREEQRAEIAAHLHDSVLQTLALIQNRAGASSEVARIARAQERELREWLYAGSHAPGSDLATELRDLAAALELDHPVRIEVIAVGDTTELGSAELAAAAREAMLNAARHAGGEISVYLERSPSAIDVFVRDRGPGFALERVPEDRLGVRESILGRMRRAGGRASVGPGAGGVGIQVHLHLELAAQEGNEDGN